MTDVTHVSYTSKRQRDIPYTDNTTTTTTNSTDITNTDALNTSKKHIITSTTPPILTLTELLNLSKIREQNKLITSKNQQRLKIYNDKINHYNNLIIISDIIRSIYIRNNKALHNINTLINIIVHDSNNNNTGNNISYTYKFIKSIIYTLCHIIPEYYNIVTVTGNDKFSEAALKINHNIKYKDMRQKIILYTNNEKDKLICNNIDI